MSRHLSVDIGGSAARCSVVQFDGGTLSLEHLFSFANAPVRSGGEWYWNAAGLFDGIKTALRLAGERYGDTLDSVAIDTMGNAFCLLDAKGGMLEPPPYTRQPEDAGEGVRERLYSRISQRDLYSVVGLETTKLNSLYHLLRYRIRRPGLLSRAKRFLMLPDLLAYWLSGEIACEYTQASTSYLLDAAARSWSYPLIRRLGFDESLFPLITPAGTVLGRLRPEIANEVGLRRIRVMQAASHDTASAIACFDDSVAGSAFISSGTWGMLGCKLERPITSDAAFAANFANEGAAFGRIMFVHNSPSMSILHKCRENWEAEGGAISWDGLFALAAEAPAFKALIEPLAPDFLDRDDMASAVPAFCRASGQPVPVGPGEVARTVLESIALSYMRAMRVMKEVVGEDFAGVTLVGGATKSPLLCGFIADALQMEVGIGPDEATSLGNALVQMLGLGLIADMDEGRRLLAGSARGKYAPQTDGEEWQAALRRMGALSERTSGLNAKSAQQHG